VRRILSTLILALAVSTLAHFSFAQTAGPYKILTSAKVGGEGGTDYIYADSTGRKLYIPRSGTAPRISIFDLDSLKPLGEIANYSAHGVAVDAASGHGFASSKPVLEFDTNSLKAIKPITVDGGPDGILGDPYTAHVYILSHRAPNITVIDAKEGTVLGTIDVGGAPEQSVLDGKGTLYVDLEDKGAIAVVDTKTLALTKTISLAGKGDGCAGLAIDTKNGILFAACRTPQVMVIVRIRDGNILATLPIGRGCDGAVFNPSTMEVFSSQGDGTLTIIKESSPTSFAVEQTVTTPIGARTITLDTKTNHILVMTAEYGPAPVPAPGAAPSRYGARGPVVPGSFTIYVIGR